MGRQNDYYLIIHCADAEPVPRFDARVCNRGVILISQQYRATLESYPPLSYYRALAPQSFQPYRLRGLGYPIARDGDAC